MICQSPHNGLQFRERVTFALQHQCTLVFTLEDVPFDVAFEDEVGNYANALVEAFTASSSFDHLFN